MLINHLSLRRNDYIMEFVIILRNLDAIDGEKE